jgi:hypothetical protein
MQAASGGADDAAGQSGAEQQQPVPIWPPLSRRGSWHSPFATRQASQTLSQAAPFASRLAPLGIPITALLPSKESRQILNGL